MASRFTSLGLHAYTEQCAVHFFLLLPVIRPTNRMASIIILSNHSQRTKNNLDAALRPSALLQLNKLCTNTNILYAQAII